VDRVTAATAGGSKKPFKRKKEARKDQRTAERGIRLYENNMSHILKGRSKVAKALRGGSKQKKKP